jgi:hypothetical protein
MLQCDTMLRAMCPPGKRPGTDDSVRTGATEAIKLVSRRTFADKVHRIQQCREVVPMPDGSEDWGDTNLQPWCHGRYMGDGHIKLHQQT